MISRTAIALAAALFCGSAAAQDSSDFIKRVQERLNALGFNAGPVNGDFGPQMQAALAQFQLSVPVPASGQLDAETLLALGEARDASASAGTSAEPGNDSRVASD
jgi:N-acetylmuramoyl-L-alanine amidase